MLLCNVCIENNERDHFIRNRTVNNLEEKINKNMSSNAETLETQIAQIVEKKINEAMRKTHDKIDESYANAVKKVESYKNVNSPQNSKNNYNSTTHSIEHNVRVQGIHEDPNKRRDVNLGQTHEKLQEILRTIWVKPKIVQCKRLETFNKERKKPRTLLVTLEDPAAVNLVIAKSTEKRDEMKEMNTFLSRALCKEDSIKENLCLKRRREMLEEGVPRQKLKIRNLELFHDGAKIQLNQTSQPEQKIATSNVWLDHLHVLQFNARSLVNHERRFKMANAIKIGLYSVICICETLLNENIANSELLLAEYNIYRADRAHQSSNTHGGALIAIRNALNSQK